MRPRFFALVFASLLSFPVVTNSQQTTAGSAQAATILKKALAALNSSTSVSDITLTGAVERITGSDDETGTATLRALAVGASRMDLNFSSGPRSEIMNISVSPAAGSWSGPDTVAHPVAYHNLLIDPAWFFPSFAISRGLGTGYTASFVGHELRNGEPVEHVAIAISQVVPQQTAPSHAQSLRIAAQMKQMDFFLDSNTLLPAAVSFDLHPDDNTLINIPIQIQFSNYRSINGVQIPFHIQKFLNNGLVLDLQFASAAVNAGLSGSDFSVTAE